MLKKFLLTISIIIFAITPSLAIKVDFVDAAVIDVAEILARESGFDLVVSGDKASLTSKRATVHLDDVSPEEALEQILSTNGINYKKKGRTILITTLPQVIQGDLEVVRLKHLSADKVSCLLKEVMPELSATSGQRASCLVMRGSRTQISEAQELIQKIDKKIPQILIESQVLEVSHTDTMELGLSYGDQTAGIFTFLTNKDTGKTGLSNDIKTTLNILMGDGRANVVAKPRIATLDDHEAVINIGSRIPYAVPAVSNSSSTLWTVDYIDAGVKLRITPRLGEDGFITTHIHPEVSAVSEWKTTAAGDFPVISTRNATATVRVKNGESIVIGGLLADAERKNIKKIPLLGHIPLLGLLFQDRSVEKSKSEIIFVITPYVI